MEKGRLMKRYQFLRLLNRTTKIIKKYPRLPKEEVYKILWYFIYNNVNDLKYLRIYHDKGLDLIMHGPFEFCCSELTSHNKTSINSMDFYKLISGINVSTDLELFFYSDYE